MFYEVHRTNFYRILTFSRSFFCPRASTCRSKSTFVCWAPGATGTASRDNSCSDRPSSTWENQVNDQISETLTRLKLKADFLQDLHGSKSKVTFLIELLEKSKWMDRIDVVKHSNLRPVTRDSNNKFWVKTVQNNFLNITFCVFSKN